MTTRKARARTLLEDPTRWAPCPRCGHCYQRARTWPEGRVCHYCATAALQTTGHCATCNHNGVLPGLDSASGRPTCRTCSGIPTAVCCRRCRLEAPLGRSSTCWRCLLTAKTEALLAGHDGAIPSALAPLAAAVAAMPSANSGHTWLSNPEVAELLRRLASGELALNHAALDELESSRTVEHLRGLLVVQGCLPPRDPHLAGYERWLAVKLDTIVDPDDIKVVDRFARWHLLRQLRERAAAGPVSDGAFINAKQTTTVTVGFLAWLSEHDIRLTQITQHDLDAWFAAGPSTRKHVVRFLYWVRDQRLINSEIEVPVPGTGQLRPVDTAQRLTLLKHVMADDDLGSVVKLAAAMVLLLGATARQITALRLEDVIEDREITWLKLGSHPLPLPDPIAELLTECMAEARYRRNTVNHQSPWLFPGTRPGRSLHANTLAAALRRAGISIHPARAGAWLDLAREAPAPLLAEALGVTTATATRYAERAGTRYQRYVEPLRS